MPVDASPHRIVGKDTGCCSSKPPTGPGCSSTSSGTACRNRAVCDPRCRRAPSPAVRDAPVADPETRRAGPLRRGQARSPSRLHPMVRNRHRTWPGTSWREVWCRFLPSRWLIRGRFRCQHSLRCRPGEVWRRFLPAGKRRDARPGTPSPAVAHSLGPAPMPPRAKDERPAYAAPRAITPVSCPPRRPSGMHIISRVAEPRRRGGAGTAHYTGGGVRGDAAGACVRAQNRGRPGRG